VVQVVNAGKSFFGICLGLQLLFESSEEHGASSGLGILKGKVLRFPHEINGKKVHVPQIGWNRIFEATTNWKESDLKSVGPGSYLYFVHSYYVTPENSEVILSNTVYEGFQYCSSIKSGNVFAVQYHPEKSGEIGLNIYRDWVSGI
jgi:glutamine amidotransferase